jgi:hypothetical protein
VKPLKIFKLFKKGSKAAAGAKKKGHGELKWPSGVRIGIFGHANSGKTVYYTVLNEDCKISKKLQIAISDTITSGHLLANYRSIWGVGVTSDVGTVVDLRSEKKFPDPTQGDKVLKFNAIVDRSSKVPVVALDYDGKAVAISEQSELKDRVADFMSSCDGLLVFYDPKMLGADMQTQEQVASFTHLMELVAPLHRRLPIPVALVVTKADILPGFTGDEQTILISPEDENFLSSDFEVFLEKVLASNKVTSSPAWAGTVRDVLVKLKEFLKVVVGRTLDFQIFFVSPVGSTPEKVGTDIGRSLYTPPDKIHPIGVKEPFHWLLKAVLKNRGIGRMRWITKLAAVLAVAWVVVFSVPYLYQFSFLHPRTLDQEDAVLQGHLEGGGSMTSLSKRQITKILDPYRSYQHKWIVNWLFRPFKQTAEQIVINYHALEKVDIEKVMDTHILTFLDVVADSSRWPAKKVDDTVFVEDENAQRFGELVSDMDSLGIDESDAALLRRQERIKWFLGKFREGILDPQASAAVWGQMNEQISRHGSREDIKLSEAEQSLYSRLMEREQKQEVVVIAKETGSAVEEFLQTINDNTDPKFRLETAPRRLESDLAALRADPANSAVIARINRYLQEVQKFKTRRPFIYRLATGPEGCHVHVMARRGNKDTSWRVGKQLWPGMTVDTISWRMGDQIVIALDSPADRETWGENSTSKKELKGRFALFEMEKAVSIGDKTVTFSLEDSLEEMLPRIE